MSSFARLTVILIAIVAVAKSVSANPYLTSSNWRSKIQGWKWVSGKSFKDSFANYGTKNVTASTNLPGARNTSLVLKNGSDVFVFAGWGFPASGANGRLNDLWKWNGTNWTWISGASAISGRPTYGTKGTANAANVPGARYGACGAVDGSGNLLVFAGDGLDAAGPSGFLNDLWRWDGTNWTWIAGQNTVDNNGVYGTKGVAAGTNVPGGRKGCNAWFSGGNLYIFGGNGFPASGGGGFLNDLWKWDGTNWTWMAGGTGTQTPGTYGTKGVANSANTPGSRHNGGTAVDSSGNLWLFGGSGNATTTTAGMLADLWKWDGTNWTWIAGPNSLDPVGVYGTKGVAAGTNLPGGRINNMMAINSSDVIFMFGGLGLDTATTQGHLNDLWKWDGTNWTWVDGKNTINPVAVYGTKGVAQIGNAPGGRETGMAWIDSTGKFHVYGGLGLDNSGTAASFLGDMWQYVP